MGPKKSIHNANEKQGSRIHSVCIFPVKYTFWPAERCSRRNSVLLKITDDLLLWAPICLPGTICDTVVWPRALKTCSLPRPAERVRPWTDENVPRACLLCAVNGNVDKYFLPWSTSFAETARGARRPQRANYERDELGVRGRVGSYLFCSFSFHCMDTIFPECKHSCCFWGARVCVWAVEATSINGYTAALPHLHVFFKMQI